MARSITQILEEIYLKADEVAKATLQTTFEKRNYYITLEQLMKILTDANYET